MIKTEYYGKNGLGVDLYRTYSDENKVICQIETGNEYDEAIDVTDENGNIKYTYEETDKYIEILEEENDYVTEEDYIQALNKLGVE